MNASGDGVMAGRRTVVMGLVLAAGIGVGVITAFRTQIATLLLERMIDRRVGRDALAGLPDGVHVLLCGTGSPLPDPDRAEACTAVLAGRHLFVVDAGDGGARTLARMGVPMGRVERVFLTHFHSDHIDGLGPLMLMRWTGSAATTALPVAGPPGVAAIVAGFNAAYAMDSRYRIAHHGAAIVPPAGAGAVAQTFAMPAGDSAVVYQNDGVTVTAIRVMHAPVTSAVGYRFAYQGRSVTLSGDTAFSPALVRAARGSDLLVHDALQPALLARVTERLAAAGLANTAQITRDIRSYHATPDQAADAARLAGVRRLVLNHIVPPMPLRIAYPAFVGDARRHFAGPITVAEDGMMFSLPTGSTAITQRGLL
jgi:ribonuclease Z